MTTAEREDTEADEWLLPPEVAAMTRLAKRTLSDKRWKGTGPPFSKLTPGRGGRIRYRRSDVEAWMNSRSPSAGEA